MNQKGKKAVASLEVRVGDHAKLAPSQKGFQEGDMHDSGVACSQKTQVVLQSSPRFVVLGSESPCFVYIIHHHTSSYISMNSMEPDPGLWPEFEFSKFFQRVAGACGTWQTVHKSPDPF